MKKQDEYHLQTQVCDYLKAQYPKVLFLSDTVASVKLTMPQAVRNKRIQKEGFKCPDLLILEIKKNNSGDPLFYGLFIELKKESPYKLNGEIKASQNDHLKLQYESILNLRKRGYFADWKWNFDEIKKLIDWYLA